ncbi:cell division protein FtsL [Paenibacillus thailandensis]|uniref:Cell division protein FtsL n=1 Tax=Paenibacillus thailandensis TaxID=393250 RepID=A0ABW5QXV1_9BACL
MAYTTNGNLALQPKKKNDRQPAYRETRKVVVKKNPIPTREKLLWMLSIAVCVIVAGVIIFRYAQIYHMNLEIKQMKNEYNSISIELKELEKQVETLSNPERIRQMAEAQGMVSTMDGDITVNPGKDEATSAMNTR